MAEVPKVLRGDKFAWPEPEIDKALRQLSRFTERVHPTHTLDIITADPPDNRILECADAGKADFIVTGDKRHILPLGSHAPLQPFLQSPILAFSSPMSLMRCRRSSRS